MPFANARVSSAGFMRIYRRISGACPALFPFRTFATQALAEEFLPLPESSSILFSLAVERVYEIKPNPAGGFQWSLKAPDAELKSLSGEVLGKHGSGPSWTLNGCSSIVGSVPPLKNLAAPASIPWLLLAVKSKSGSGILDKVDYVMRVATNGGVAPAEPPKAEGETVKVKYHAISSFSTRREKASVGLLARTTLGQRSLGLGLPIGPRIASADLMMSAIFILAGGWRKK